MLAGLCKEGRLSYLDLAVVRKKLRACPNRIGNEDYKEIVERGSPGAESIKSEHFGKNY